MAKLTQYELEQMETHATGACELVLNEEHFARVIRDGMAKARVSLDIMTADFKAMLVPLGAGGAGRGKGRKADSVVHLFRRLAERGVELRILHAGTPSGPALVELKKALLPGKPGRRKKPAALVLNEDGQQRLANLTIRRCPRLHAKAVIIDARAMYLGSANLTGAGLGAKAADKRNFEIGIWTESAPMIERVSEQFNRLWEGHCCETCRRKDVCPVPLEEPRL